MLKSVCIVALMLVASFSASAQGSMPLSLVFVPSRDADQVPVEIVFPTRSSPDASRKAQALRRLIEQNGLRPERDGDHYTYSGKCIVQPQQFSVGEATLRVECWSMAMWRGDDPFSTIGVPDTPEEAMILIEAFFEKHRERLLRPRPGERTKAAMV